MDKIDTQYYIRKAKKIDQYRNFYAKSHKVTIEEAIADSEKYQVANRLERERGRKYPYCDCSILMHGLLPDYKNNNYFKFIAGKNKRRNPMDMFVNYAPVIVVVLMFLLHERIVVTPEQLEKKHREILSEIEQRFTTKNSFEDLKGQFSEMKDKIDKIYDCLILK